MHDIIICGGGLAGLTLARQLKMADRRFSILVLDKERSPLPVAGHKVGESTVEAAGHYYGETLRLKEYLKAKHLVKHGLRFFLGSGQLPIQNRLEEGIREPLLLDSYQLDRGILETDLRQMIQEQGVALREGSRVRDISLGSNGSCHSVTFVNQEGALETADARWLIDAMGRRRFLQSKLGLGRPTAHRASAAWWRVKGRVCVDDLVPQTDVEWHAQAGSCDRWLSTNHFMGNGYWVWLIPLSSGNTSVGIVTEEALHPVKNMSTHELASEWLVKHEPHIATLLKSTDLVDFKALKDFAYLTSQAFSADRWACVGEAAAFVDPLYSPGSDFIAWSNTLATAMIQDSFRDKLTADDVDFSNLLYRELLEGMLSAYEGQYSGFSKPRVYLYKFLWDSFIYWCGIASPLFHDFVYDFSVLREYYKLLQPLIRLNIRVQELLKDWGALSNGAVWRGCHQLTAIRPVVETYIDMGKRKTPAEFMAFFERGIARCEELAQVVFFTALDEVLPERSFGSSPPWVNAWAIGLDPEKWEKDGLFSPPTVPRDILLLSQQVQDALDPPRS